MALKPEDFRFRDENGVMMPFSLDAYRRSVSMLTDVEHLSVTERIGSYRYPLHHYLAQVTPDHGVFRFLDHYGKRMRMASMPARPLKEAMWHCYSYSRFAIEDFQAQNCGDTFMYAEGLGLTPFGRYLHAWNLVHGKVFDVSWSSNVNHQYFGIAFTHEFLRFMHFTTGHYCGFTRKNVFARCAPYLDNYAQNWKMPKLPPFDGLAALAR